MMQLFITTPAIASDAPLVHRLSGMCRIALNETGRGLTKEELKIVAEAFDVLIVRASDVLDNEVLTSARVQIIGALGGLDNINLVECQRQNIVVFDAIGANTVSVAEHTFALILALAKKLIELNHGTRSGSFEGLRGRVSDLAGKTLGVVGAGKIAREVIARAGAFSMNIICWTPHPRHHGDMSVRFVNLDELLSTSDFISLHIKSTEATEHLIDAGALGKMKPQAFLINTSRGDLIDEAALVEALQANHIAGAGLDVFAEEPTQNTVLCNLSNVVLTPHTAGVSREATENVQKVLAEKIISFITASTSRNP